MPTCLILSRWTQQGIQSVKDSPARLDAAKQPIKAMGGEAKAFYLLMGQYDFAVVIEAPDDEAVARFVLTIGAQGNARTETMKAFPEEEYRKIIASLP